TNEYRVVVELDDAAVDEPFVLGRTRFGAHVDARDTGRLGGTDLHHILHPAVDHFESRVGDMAYGLVLHMKAAEKRVILGGTFDAFYEMRRIVEPFVGNDAHRIGHLQRRDKHLILADAHGNHRAGVPGTFVVFVVGRRIGDIAAVFAGEI